MNLPADRSGGDGGCPHLDVEVHFTDGTGLVGFETCLRCGLRRAIGADGEPEFAWRPPPGDAGSDVSAAGP